MKSLHAVAYALVIIGALNWGLIALGTYMGGNWNLVQLILGSWPALVTLVYLLVGLAALDILFKRKGAAM